MLPYLADWKFDWLDIPDLMTRSAEILQYAMVDRDPLTSWGRAPGVPARVERRSQAIVDARVLARELSVAGTPEDAIAAYEAARVPATTEIMLATRHMPVDRVVDMVHDRAPTASPASRTC